MKNIVLFLVVVFSLQSCLKKPVEKPDNLIDEEQMIEILYDVTLLQAAKNINTTKLSQNHINYNTYIFEKYGIDSTTYVQSQLYYASIPEVYQEMHKVIEKRLTKERQILDSIKEDKASQEKIKKPVLEQNKIIKNKSLQLND